ncbi:MAG: hypothetical protein FWE95_01915 [Planctomycetaceae bacterium]|nr:hypothetical protein [Planctomycetaceae bacterium]
MKKIVPLLLCLAMLALTGCPEKPAATTGSAAGGGEALAAAKPQEVLDRIAAYKAKWDISAEKRAQYKPKILVTLPAELQQPDGMTVNPVTKTVFVNFPNFNGREENVGPKLFPAALGRLKFNGDTATVEKLFIYEDKAPFPETGQVGPMGLFFGPDGHLYVCDNQYFFNSDNKSRMLRVRMDGDNPTGEVEVVVEGTKLSNAVYWTDDTMFVTDTFLDLDGVYGGGCVWAFPKEEVFKAGTDGNPPIKVTPIKSLTDAPPYCLVIAPVVDLPGCGHAGADGLTADKNGVLYFGNFGDGAVFRVVIGEDGKATMDTIHEAGDYFGCCDGIFYDADTNKIYVNDSAANAIHAFVPPAPGQKAVFETLWENGDTDGADGSLDQPAELVVVNGKMIIANFDWPFPELLNTEFNSPGTISVINLK